MTDSPRQDLLTELLNRFSSASTKLDSHVAEYTGRGERLLGHLFKEQLEFARDPAKRKAACCSRRAGKTTAAAAILGQYAENYPGGLCIYIATTAKHAKKLMWPELKRLNKLYQLGWRFNNVEMFATTPGGSVIALAGADKEDSIEQFRGLAPVLAVLDESASFKKHLAALIEEVIEPSLEDYNAPLVMVGTPGRVPKGYFYEATAGPSQEWSRHHWTFLQNSQHPRWSGKEDWQKRARSRLEAIMIAKGWTQDTPKFKREYLGLWCRDETRMLYRYDPHLNLVDHLPEDRAWDFVMGIDLGYRGTAFVVFAYAIDDPYAYVVWAEKHRKMGITQIAERGDELSSMFSPMKSRVIDEGGLGKVIARHLAERFHFACIPAEKTNKMGTIETMNDDLLVGIVKVVRKVGGALVREWESLETDEDGNEMKGSDNHCADAALYAWRKCRHFLRAPVGPPKPGQEGYEDWYEEQMWERMRKPPGRDSAWEPPAGLDYCSGDSAVSERMSANWGDSG